MKVAIPQWQERISPVFDVACKLLLFEVKQGRIETHRAVNIPAGNTSKRIEILHRLGVKILICGAISQPLEAAVISTGIWVISYTCGHVKDVLNAFLNGELRDEAFLMPGCDCKKRRIPSFDDSLF